jgi:hypothetical protein
MPTDLHANADASCLHMGRYRIDNVKMQALRDARQQPDDTSARKRPASSHRLIMRSHFIHARNISCDGSADAIARVNSTRR